jgi:mRNA interferase MazF
MKKRGEIYWLNFDPSIGTETKHRRPAVIVSIGKSNRTGFRYQVIPLTSNSKKVYPGEVLIQFMDGKSKALVDQVSSSSKERFSGKLGKLNDEELRKIEEVLFYQLGLNRIATLNEEE